MIRSWIRLSRRSIPGSSVRFATLPEIVFVLFNRRQHSLTPATPQAFRQTCVRARFVAQVFLELFGGHLRQFGSLSLRVLALTLITGCCRNLLRLGLLCRTWSRGLLPLVVILPRVLAATDCFVCELH